MQLVAGRVEIKTQPMRLECPNRFFPPPTEVWRLAVPLNNHMDMLPPEYLPYSSLGLLPPPSQLSFETHPGRDCCLVPPTAQP